MRCALCKNQGKVQYLEKKLCNSCFLKIIEKRVRKYLRINKVISKDDKILVIGDISLYMIKSILPHISSKIYSRKRIDKEFIKKNKINKIVINHTLDDEINYFMKEVLKEKKEKNNYIKLLKTCTDDEITKFAKIKKIKFRPNKKDKDVQHFIDFLDKKYPDTKFKLAKTVELMKKLR